MPHLAFELDKGTTNAAGGSFAAAETTITAFDSSGNKAQVSVLNGSAAGHPAPATSRLLASPFA